MVNSQSRKGFCNCLNAFLVTAFDFISLYGLDSIDHMPPGVKVIEGSNSLQKAYRLSKKVHILAPTRYVITG